ncbi:MAG: type II toxin-antitoxin system RelE/ParE family toxin [Lachnospiraceae bacterium]|jgi:phage-related protein|nr:type II toxin-antitoxin system RelE/ParE family toxin [Lachnospiraceae bacterium]
MEKIIFTSYTRKNGHNEFLEWFQRLPIKDQAKLQDIILRIEEHGLLVAQRMLWVKKIEGENNLYEIRSKQSSNIQRALYFHVENGYYVITHGFTKKTSKTPKSEIDHAILIREEWRIENE